MKWGFAWLPSAFRLSAALIGGRAPACWWRDVARRTGGLTAVRRGGAWVEDLGAIHPKLCEAPLLGTTLSVLTDYASQAQEAQPKTARLGKAGVARWENPLEPKSTKITAHARTDSSFQPEVSNRCQSVAKRKLPEETPAGRSAENLSQLQAQADRSLLSRLAGSLVAFERTEQAHVGFFPVKEKPRKETSFLSVCRDPAAQQDWLNCLVQRAGKAIIQKQPDTTGTVKPAEGDAQIPIQSPTLQEQWAMAVEGTCASLDLLDRLAQEAFPGDEGRSGATPLRVSHSQPPSFSEKPRSPRQVKKADESSQRLDKWDDWRAESVSDDHELGPKPTLPVTAQASSAFFAPEFDINGPAGYGAGKSKYSAQIIPLNVMPLLPDLLPPQRVGVPPLPVAAATARRGAREEGLKAADDLDVLAAKFKQILDEQARRHGIDV